MPTSNPCNQSMIVVLHSPQSGRRTVATGGAAARRRPADAQPVGKVFPRGSSPREGRRSSKIPRGPIPLPLPGQSRISTSMIHELRFVRPRADGAPLVATNLSPSGANVANGSTRGTDLRRGSRCPASFKSWVGEQSWPPREERAVRIIDLTSARAGDDNAPPSTLTSSARLIAGLFGSCHLCIPYL